MFPDNYHAQTVKNPKFDARLTDLKTLNFAYKDPKTIPDKIGHPNTSLNEYGNNNPANHSMIPGHSFLNDNLDDLVRKEI